MKTRAVVLAALVWLASSVVLTSFLSADAQSGRVVPTPTPTPATPEASEFKPKFVVDSSADKYQLVFSTVFEGILYKKKLYPVAGPLAYDSFIELLNNAGGRGYRLTSATRSGGIVALVKLDTVQYEYAWFATGSDLRWVTKGFEGSYSQLSKHGLRVVDHAVMKYDCPTNADDYLNGETCDIEDLYLLERKKGVEELAQHRVVASAPGWRGDRSAGLTAQVNEKIPQGFYPSMVLSKFEVLLEQGKKDDPLAGKQDVQVVTSSQWHDDMKKKANALAKQGYRIAFTGRETAVMYRDSATASPASYVWLEAGKTDFENQLANLQEQGAVYRTTYPSKSGHEDQLVFEKDAVDDGKRREYKVLKFGFQDVPDFEKKEVHLDLDPSARETMKLLNRLVNEGFTVRDLFFSNKVSVLLERPR